MTNGEWETLYGLEAPRSTAGLNGWQRYMYSVWLKDVADWYAGAGTPPLICLLMTTDGKGLYWFDTTTLGGAAADDLEHPVDLPISL